MKENDPGAPWDAEEVISALLSRAQQRVLCHQEDEALADLMLWPETSRQKMKNDFAVSIRDVSPDFAKRLGEGSESK